ncbi:hypothetical protein H0H81_006729 [Sphagnurus paluster]|uniref:Uncharacterized protein n=1 Tax=Sphagnurus paluster TaxID=117069 RepID=A0A9P7GS36_9AGAR|nr:hypothetical protein H0H81_006729 [Sphagnurus paluster]
MPGWIPFPVWPSSSSASDSSSREHKKHRYKQREVPDDRMLHDSDQMSVTEEGSSTTVFIPPTSPAEVIRPRYASALRPITDNTIVAPQIQPQDSWSTVKNQPTIEPLSREERGRLISAPAKPKSRALTSLKIVTDGMGPQQSSNTGDKDEMRRITIERLERENNMLKRELGILQKEKREFQKDIKSLGEENMKLHRDIREARQQHAQFDNYYTLLQQEAFAVKDELRRAEAQHELTRNLLKERTTELQSAQLFVNQADSLSGADVIAMANALNAEILQGAAFMADSLDYVRGGVPPTADAIARTRPWVGKDLTQALLTQRDRDDFDPTVVQLALQVCLVQCCKMFVESWTVREDAVLKDIYGRIYREGQ